MSLLTVDLYQSTLDQDYGELTRYQEAFQFDPEQTYAGVDAAKLAAEILTVKWAMYSRNS